MDAYGYLQERSVGLNAANWEAGNDRKRGSYAQNRED